MKKLSKVLSKLDKNGISAELFAIIFMAGVFLMFFSTRENIGLSSVLSHILTMVGVFMSVGSLVPIAFVFVHRYLISIHRIKVKSIKKLREKIYENQISELLANEEWDEVKKRFKLISNKMIKSFYRGYMTAKGVDIKDLD